MTDTTLVAGTFAQITPQPGPSWHIVVAEGVALCGTSIRCAEYWTTDQMRSFKVCETCRADAPHPFVGHDEDPDYCQNCDHMRANDLVH